MSDQENGSAQQPGATQQTSSPPKPLRSRTTVTFIAAKRSTTTLLGALSKIPGVNPLKQLWNSSWTAEWISCVFALLSLLGLVATLVAHQNKPIPQWPQLVSLNSIVSLFALLMRSGTTVVLSEGISQSKWQWFRRARKLKDLEQIDSASRGAFGSFLLLLNLNPKSRPYYIAAFGAFLTIMSAWTGFTSQQVIQFTNCEFRDTSTIVGIARTNNFFLHGGENGGASGLVSDAMAAGIETGIVQPPRPKDLTNTLSHGCTTGNCTFPSVKGASFQTIGVSHTCTDVTSQVREETEREVIYYPDPDQIGNSSVRNEDMFNLTRVVDWANLTSPAGANASQYQGHGVGLPLNSKYTLVTGAHNAAPHFQAIQIMYRRNSGDKNYTALNCSIFPSINTYGVAITNNFIEERLLESVPIGDNLARSLSFQRTHRRATNFFLKNGQWEPCKRQEQNVTSLIEVAEGNIDAAPEATTRELLDKLWWYPKECVYDVGLRPATGTSGYLRMLFDGMGLVQTPGSVQPSYNGPIHLRRLWREGNISPDTVNEYMAKLTASMTAVLRTNGQFGQAEHANGTVWQTTTCLQISWPWLSFPAAMIGLSAIFLVLVQIENRGIKSERLWKSSVLATLFCDVEEAVKTNQGKPLEKRDMDRIAKSTSMSLESDNQTLKLVQR